MKLNKNVVLAVVAGVLAPLAIWAASQQFLSPSAAVNCESGGGCNIAINGGTYNATAPASEQVFGAGVDDTSQWTAGNFTSDLRVGGTLSASGSLMVAGSATFLSGISDPSGSVVSAVSSSMSATSTACVIQNTSNRTRTLLSIGIVAPSTTNVGTFLITAGTSTDGWTTSTSPLVQANVVTVGGNGLDVITPTSTINSSTVTLHTPFGYAPWRNNEYLIYKVSSTTLQGTCRASYY